MTAWTAWTAWTKHSTCAVLTIAAFAGISHAQALEREAERATAPAQSDAALEQGEQLRATSLYFVEKPKPRQFQIHDKVTIIINESTRQSSQQNLDAKKDASLKATLKKFPDLADLVQGELSNGSSDPVTAVDASAGSSFKGDGKFERTDRLTDRITATVIDVKPNGVLVIEARRSVRYNEDEQTVVLSGECRREDVTDANSILSSQLAELKLVFTREGQVSDSGRKGFLTRLFDAVFNF